jgi:hypothetical protein
LVLASFTEINRHLAEYLKKENLPEIDLITASRWLHKEGFLKDAKERPGLPLRKLLRSGKIDGAHQYPNRRWVIRQTDKEPAYSVKEAAAELGLSEHAIYKRIARGLLKPQNLGPKSFVIPKSEILRQQNEHMPLDSGPQDVPCDERLNRIKQQLQKLQTDLARVVADVDQLSSTSPLSDENKQTPGFRTIEGLKAWGFEGFITLGKYNGSPVNPVPDKKGVYMVLYTAARPAVFLKKSKAGRFRGRNPTADLEELKQRWVKNTIVLFIAQAGGGNSSATLGSRIRQLAAFGRGKPISHWEGRYLWQIRDAADLILCWKTTPADDPRAIERDYLNRFLSEYHTLPFANPAD